MGYAVDCFLDKLDDEISCPTCMQIIWKFNVASQHNCLDELDRNVNSKERLVEIENKKILYQEKMIETQNSLISTQQTIINSINRTLSAFKPNIMDSINSKEAQEKIFELLVSLTDCKSLTISSLESILKSQKRVLQSRNKIKKAENSITDSLHRIRQLLTANQI